MRTRIFALLSMLAALTTAAGAQAPSPAPQTASPIFDAVRARGYVMCGVSPGVPGFSMPDAQGNWRGIDVDICRAVAAALFGDATKVRFQPLSIQQRFTAVQSGEVDILSRNTTVSYARDVGLGLDFPVIAFYDGQGFMVPRRLNVTNARQLNGASVCIQTGTTTELNLADWARANNVQLQSVVIESTEQMRSSYFSGRCDLYTTDVSGLAAVRSVAQNPADHVILPEVISKEPLGPAVRQGDQRWSHLVRWSVHALVEAEELGLTSANIEQRLNDANPGVQRFVGAQGELGQMMGIDNRWAFNIVRQVGNYAEVFARNITPLGIERGPNRLWRDGGLLYAPPFR
jgi:general L-amino acid transport system substrate-binding protein